MIRKIISIVVAVAINVAVLAWFHTWSAAVVASAAASAPQPAVTLPVINVHPSAAQLHALQHGHAAGAVPTSARRS